MHSNHAKRNHIRQSSKNISKSDRKEIRIGDKSCAASSLNMNMHYVRNMERSNITSIFSERQIRYICDDIFPSSNDNNGEHFKNADIDNIYSYLRDIRYPHVSLLQKVVEK